MHQLLHHVIQYKNANEVRSMYKQKIWTYSKVTIARQISQNFGKLSQLHLKNIADLLIVSSIKETVDNGFADTYTDKRKFP